MNQSVRPKALVIVAHCDDETLWMGGTLNRVPLDWTIISITNDDTHGRDPQFHDNCNRIGAKSYILHEKQGLNISWSHEKVKQKILDIIGPKEEWSLIFTHNKNGEYGHFQHKEVHKIVKSMFKEIYTFGYNIENTDLTTSLNSSERDKKIEMAKRYIHKWCALKNYEYMFAIQETFKKETT